MVSYKYEASPHYFPCSISYHSAPIFPIFVRKPFPSKFSYSWWWASADRCNCRSFRCWCSIGRWPLWYRLYRSCCSRESSWKFRISWLRYFPAPGVSLWCLRCSPPLLPHADNTSADASIIPTILFSYNPLSVRPVPMWRPCVSSAIRKLFLLSHRSAGNREVRKTRYFSKFLCAKFSSVAINSFRCLSCRSTSFFSRRSLSSAPFMTSSRLT